MLEDEGLQVDLDTSAAAQLPISDNPIATQASSANISRTRRSREIAHALQEKRAALERFQDDLRKIETAQAVKPNATLVRRRKSINSKLATLRLKIKDLETARKGLVPDQDKPPTSDTAHTVNPHSSNDVTAASPLVPPGKGSNWPGLLTTILQAVWKLLREPLLKIPLLAAIIPFIDSMLGSAAEEQQ